MQQKLSYQEISDIINSDPFEEIGAGPTEWMQNDLWSLNRQEDADLVAEINKLGKFKLVTKFGGVGYGDKYYSVFHFIDHNIWIKFDGWYTSYEGSEFSEMYEVKPVEVMVTKYEKV